jgi:Tol biopolymer transport system component
MLTSNAGLTTDPTLSPDGRFLAYASDRDGGGNLDLWIQPLSGDPIQLTDDPAEEREPAFSPDGAKIAFRSDRAGGGLYVMSALGREEPGLLAAGGRTPRFSPDGQWVAYWVGQTLRTTPGGKASKMFVVPAAGGTPRPVQAAFTNALLPTWSADGRHLLFVGRRDENSQLDWWVTSPDGDAATRTGALPAFAKHGINPVLATPSAWSPQGIVLFSAASGDSTNLYRARISPTEGLLSEAPERLTLGSAREVQPAAVGDRIVFASLNENVNVWSLRLDANAARVLAQPEQVTQHPTDAFVYSITDDAQTILFRSDRAGQGTVYTKDLETGRETVVVQRDQPSFAQHSLLYSALSPDGGRMAYRYMAGAEGTRRSFVDVVDLRTLNAKRLCENCGSVWDWSADGRKLLVARQVGERQGAPVDLVDAGTLQRREFLAHPTWGVFRAQFAPDDRWVAFHSGGDSPIRQVFVAAVGDERAARPEEWIAVTDRYGGFMPSWSPDGSLLYFFSGRDDFACLWSQRLDPHTRRPVGAPQAVHHFHDARRHARVTGGPITAVGRDRVVFSLADVTGNIWMIEVPEKDEKKR